MGAPTAGLTNMIFMTGFLVVTGAFEALYTATAVRESNPFTNLVVTQRFRYGVLAFGQIIMLGLAIRLFSQASLPEILAGISETAQVMPVGPVLAFANIVALSSPLWTGLIALRIYRNPAYLAFGKRGYGYLPTEAKRLGYRDWYNVPRVVIDAKGPRYDYLYPNWHGNAAQTAQIHVNARLAYLPAAPSYPNSNWYDAPNPRATANKPKHRHLLGIAATTLR